jgi:hypothetical protein
MNIIITKTWMYVVPVSEPYFVQRGIPIYLSPMSYLGYLIKPVLDDTWPQTGKLSLEPYHRSPITLLRE